MITSFYFFYYYLFLFKIIYKNRFCFNFIFFWFFHLSYLIRNFLLFFFHFHPLIFYFILIAILKKQLDDWEFYFLIFLGLHFIWEIWSYDSGHIFIFTCFLFLGYFFIFFLNFFHSILGYLAFNFTLLISFYFLVFIWGYPELQVC